MTSTKSSTISARVARPPASSAAPALALLLLLCPLAFGAPAAASEAGSEARAVIEETVVEVLAVLNAEDLSTEARLARIEEIAYARFDFDIIARLVLSRGWKRFSADQQQEFIREFKDYLANSYGQRIEVYNQEKVAVVGVRDEPRGDVTVHTKIVGGEYDGALVDYRMRQREGSWRVIDVVIEGISLVSNYRDQFRAVMSRHGPDGLLEQLRKKNAASGAEGGSARAAS
jgi:phospholipid transport system substrate-binding protein